MRNILILLCLLSATVYSQNSVIVLDACAPQTYQSTVMVSYTPDMGVCEASFVGPLLPMKESVGKTYKTLKVMAGKTYHDKLPKGFGVRSTDIHRYYMHPYLFKVLGETRAIKRAKEAGFPCPEIVQIQGVYEFPGFEFN